MTVQDETAGPLTTEAGAPVADNQQSQTAGAGGPTLIQDQLLLEKLAHFNRERIPERIVHARRAEAKATTARTHGRDGVMYDGRHAGAKNYEPNSFGGPRQTDKPLWEPVAVSGHTGGHVAPSHAEDDDFAQAGNLYRMMSEEEQQRLVDNIAGGLSQVSREDIARRAIENFRKADEDYGKRLEAAVQALRG